MPADILGVPAEAATIAAFVLASGVIAWPVVSRYRSRRVGGKSLRQLAFGTAEIKVDGVVVKSAEPGWNTIVPQLQIDMATVLANTSQLLHENRPNGGDTSAPGDALKRVEDGLATLGGQVQQLLDIKASQ